MSAGQSATGLKRGASVSPNKEEAPKKAKVAASTQNNNMGKNDNGKSESVNIGATLELISKNIAEMRGEFSTRIDKLEAGLADKIRDVVQVEVGKVRDDLQGQIDKITSNLGAVQKQVDRTSDIKRNVVIFGIPASDNENVKNKVNAVIREGVKVNVEVDTAIRKPSKKDGKSSIIIATFKNLDDKEKVMENKKKLGKSVNHKNVSIDHERSVEELQYQANLRVLSEAVGKDKVVVKGRRVVPAKKKEGHT